MGTENKRQVKEADNIQEGTDGPLYPKLVVVVIGVTPPNNSMV